MSGILRDGDRGASVGWQDGELIGDSEITERVRRLADTFPNRCWSSEQDPETYGHPLDDPYAAAAIMREVFAPPPHEPEIQGALEIIDRERPGEDM